MSSFKKGSIAHTGISALEVLAEEASHKLAYLQLHRLKMCNHYPDGSTSKAYYYETILRRNLDAVAILLFEIKQAPEEEVWVHLKRTLRPPLAMREYFSQKQKPGKIETKEEPIILEVVAGLLEEGDQGEVGRQDRAVKEVWEEAGFKIAADQLIALGREILPTPGMNPEQIFLYAAEIKPNEAQPPPGDGSPTEEIGGLVSMSLTKALKACILGDIRDAKTEICLHRFHILLTSPK